MLCQIYFNAPIRSLTRPYRVSIVFDMGPSRVYPMRHVTITSHPPPMCWKRPTEMAFVGAPLSPVGLQRSPTVLRLVGG